MCIYTYVCVYTYIYIYTLGILSEILLRRYLLSVYILYSKKIEQSPEYFFCFFTRSTFDTAAIEREKRTILQEMEEVEKVEEEVVFDNLHYTGAV
jgi:predicted Zn-dependent peptidase